MLGAQAPRDGRAAGDASGRRSGTRSGRCSPTSCAPRTPTWHEDQMLVLERNGTAEAGYFTYSFSPARDESGEVAGVFTAVHRDDGERGLDPAPADDHRPRRADGGPALARRRSRDAATGGAGRGRRGRPVRALDCRDRGRRARRSTSRGRRAIDAARLRRPRRWCSAVDEPAAAAPAVADHRAGSFARSCSASARRGRSTTSTPSVARSAEQGAAADALSSSSTGPRRSSSPTSRTSSARR